jgi:magnesium chelatase family protein
MPSKVYSVANVGFEAQIIEVEIAISHGLRSFQIVGLPNKSVQESKERVCAALKSSKFKSPQQGCYNIVVNLAPADLEKQGSHYDLAIAVNFLLETKQIKFVSTEKIFIGELSLDGKIKAVKGVLLMALVAKKQGFKEIILPQENRLEANLINIAEKDEEKKIKIIGRENINQVVDYLERGYLHQKENSSKLNNIDFQDEVLLQQTSESFLVNKKPNLTDFCYIKGHQLAKRALEIAATGGHNILMFGPPGTGKTILAKAITSILPQLSFEEALEVTKIYSLTGLLSKDNPLIVNPPFRAPHHTSSKTSLLGGGNIFRPGEITMAHRGVLFLDEFPEFHRDVLESLRQPVEEGKITILRAKYSLSLDCSFILVLAANPCPCGFLNDSDRECKCNSSQINKYHRKLSGPLIDRVDIFIEVGKVEYVKLSDEKLEEKSAIIRDRVKKAREIQLKRVNANNNPNKVDYLNSRISIDKIKDYCRIDNQSDVILKKYVDSGKLSPRGYHRVLKVSRTIADLDLSDNIQFKHVTEALMYRIKN